MKGIKIGVAIATTVFLLFGTASVVSATTTSPNKKMFRVLPGLRYMLLDRAVILP